jgi:non-canonical (house-cleaning) NTP pyrophosphatase
MKILVGTENKRKIDAVRTVLDSIGISDDFVISGCLVPSLVPETPLNEETKQGAINRAKNAQIFDNGHDLYIGIESGLVKRFDEMYEEVWSAVIYENKIYTAYSSGIKLPEIVSSKLLVDVSNHQDVMGLLRDEYKIDVSTKFGIDTWGNYTGNKIRREVGLEEAVRNALVQVFPNDKSFYERG